MSDDADDGAEWTEHDIPADEDDDPALPEDAAVAMAERALADAKAARTRARLAHQFRLHKSAHEKILADKAAADGAVKGFALGEPKAIATTGDAPTESNHALALRVTLIASEAIKQRSTISSLEERIAAVERAAKREIRASHLQWQMPPFPTSYLDIHQRVSAYERFLDTTSANVRFNRLNQGAQMMKLLMDMADHMRTVGLLTPDPDNRTKEPR